MERGGAGAPATADPGDGLSAEELAEHAVVDLPDREAMSLIRPGLGLIEGNIVEPPAQPRLDPSQPPTQGVPTTGGPAPEPMPPQPLPPESEPQTQPPVAESPPQPYEPSQSGTSTT